MASKGNPGAVRGPQLGEPTIEVRKFKQACNRLEHLRGLKQAPDKLMERLLRKYSAINVRDGKVNYRLFDLPAASGGQSSPTRGGDGRQG